MPDIQAFVAEVWDYYAQHGRTLPWRLAESDGSFDPYKILVSEIMLQQTQVVRVTVKYQQFLTSFPNVQALARAPLGEVLRQWQGLGYNRRAKFLWQAAQLLVQNYAGQFPTDQRELTKLPGVGLNTAGAICAYAYNQPTIFIETNIRSVYIHHFFPNDEAVDDKQLLPLIQQSLQHIDDWEEQPKQRSHSLPGALRNPEKVSHYREWYWALMDYGSHLKAIQGNASRSSKHFTKQSKFEGSRRQIRGQVLRLLTKGPASGKVLARDIADDRLADVLQVLQAEGMIVKNRQNYQLG